MYKSDQYIYLGIFLTSVGTLSTATFNKVVWGISGDNWQSVSQLLALYPPLQLYNYISFMRSIFSIDDFIEDCKQCE